MASPAIAVIWTYRATIKALIQRWNTDPVYSHGYVVVVLAAVLLAARRRDYGRVPLRTNWWGVPWLVAALATYQAGTVFFVEWFDAISLLVCLCGVAALCGGGQALRCSAPAIAFLAFMIPLPFRAEQAVAQPLQTLATNAGTYTLQTLGIPALADGNVIVLEDARLGVAEACSGLRMLLIFLALATAIALLIEQPRWLKLVLVSTAVPIALVSNWARITTTGVLHVAVSSRAADRFFHDFAGWMMMPLALALLWVELRLLSALAGRSTRTWSTT
jgi:exosortase